MGGRRTRLAAVLLSVLAWLGGCSSSPSGALPDAAPLTSVEGLVLERYLGTWYEIAKYPMRFEEGLVGVTATYSLRPDGKVRVENAGFEGDFDGERKTAVAKAWAPDPERPSELKVEFFWPFRADYWVVALDPDYAWAVVGEPERRYLWVLSRTPALDEGTYAGILARITALGYDVTRLEPMPQPAEPR